MTKTVVGLFDTLTEAQNVVKDLTNAGFKREDISLLANDAGKQYGTYLDQGAVPTEDAVGPGKGAGFGAVVGALTGILVGMSALVIPGIGPVIAAGPIIGGVTGLVAGAATGGIVAGLVKTGIPEEEAHYYAEGVRRGGTLVTVTSPDGDAKRARQIMDQHKPVNVQERAADWQKSGWKGFDEKATPYKAPATDQPRNANTGETVLPVVEEELKVGKREVEGAGSVHVEKRVTEKPVEEQVKLRQERVNVERRPVDRAASDADAAFKETSFDMTEMSEEPVVSKTARVIEEVVVGKDVSERTETVRDTVRRTDVDVKQTGKKGKAKDSANPNTQDWSAYDTDFRNDYTKKYANSGYKYDEFVPVYRYGYSIANDPAFSGDWSAVEPEARRRWEERNPNTWQEFKDAVRYAWDKVRGKDTSAAV